MKLLLDQGLPRSTVRHLHYARVEATHLGDRGLATASDATILDLARHERSIVAAPRWLQTANDAGILNVAAGLPAISNGGGIPPAATTTIAARCGAKPCAPRLNHQGSPGTEGPSARLSSPPRAWRLPCDTGAPPWGKLLAGWPPRNRSPAVAHASVWRRCGPPGRTRSFRPAASSGSRCTSAAPSTAQSPRQSPESADSAICWCRATPGPSVSGLPGQWLQERRAEDARGSATDRSSGSERGSR